MLPLLLSSFYIYELGSRIDYFGRILSDPHPIIAIIAAPAKHVPAYIITISNLPPPTSKPSFSCIVVVDLPLGRDNAVVIGVDRILPSPRDIIKYPIKVVDKRGSSSAVHLSEVVEAGKSGGAY